LIRHIVPLFHDNIGMQPTPFRKIFELRIPTECRMKTPVIVINFKAYSESLGMHAIRLARMAEDISKETGVNLCVAPQWVDLRSVASQVQIPVFAQAVDSAVSGSFTGSNTIEAAKDALADGMLVNHSERRITLSLMSEIVSAAKTSGLVSIVCADTPEATAAACALNPDFVAIEPPELIGTGIPVSKAKPEVVTKAIEKVKSLNSLSKVICGAGISTEEDVAAALRLGTVGVLLASGVVRAKDPQSVMLRMAIATGAKE